ncbi:hypothetical protein NQ314_020179 [Rhamnusium bicolor]|uniref:Uncharacterized protein n=1 Tax=Rhamnusium bicolor TaxID=1586634 RepID=A0AAV8WKV5_9CUCU|nr:hypothetical protein NQ314_020179 [Rhamnusium bicolor]
MYCELYVSQSHETPGYCSVGVVQCCSERVSCVNAILLFAFHNSFTLVTYLEETANCRDKKRKASF